MDDWQDAQREEGLAALYEEFKPQAIEEFVNDRMRSFYCENPTLLESAVHYLDEGRSYLAAGDDTAALFFAVVAMEVGVKVGILKPLVYGIVHQDSVAKLVVDVTIKNTQSLSQVKKPLFGILKECIGVDLDTEKRPGSSKTLWEEMKNVQDARNTCAHQAAKASREDAKLAVAVAAEVLEKLFPEVVKTMGFHVHGGRVCNNYRCGETSCAAFLKPLENG